MLATIPSCSPSHPVAIVDNFSQTGRRLDLALLRLKSAGLRVTKPRVAIIEALLRQERPVSVPQLYRDLRAEACDLVSAYRCLALFEAVGLVRRWYFRNGVGLFELNLDNSRHHYVVCRTCGMVERIDVDFAANTERSLRERGYEQVTDLVQFFGVCPECQAKAP